MTGSGRAELLPAGEGVGLDGLGERVDAYARGQTPEGLKMTHDPGFVSFFFHLFASIFVYAGLWTIGSYFWHVAGRFASRISVRSA